MTSRPLRILAAASLLLTALLSVVSVLLQPDFAADPTHRLADLAAAGSSATVSVVTFALSQLPFMVAVVAMAAMAHARAPRTAWTGGVLGVLGGFAHSVFGGLSLTYLALASDTAHRPAMAAVITRVEAGPAKVFMALGLLGTVLGLLFLGVALFRSRVAPRWVPVAIWVFLVLEFAGTGVAAWVSPAAGLVLFAAFGALALQVVRGADEPAIPSDLAVRAQAVEA
jgi:hypothetical protein